MIEYELSERADELLARNAISHESLKFDYEFLMDFPDAEFAFDFLVDAVQAEMGVIRVVFADCEITPRD